MFQLYKYHLQLIAITFLSSLIFLGTFSLNITERLGLGEASLLTIAANYDGPNYMIIAKCGYNTDCIRHTFSFSLPLEYYPAHLPGYPILIRLFNFFTNGPIAMMLATFSGAMVLVLAAFELFKFYTRSKNAFWLSLVFLFLPGRLFILRNVGAPETWFIGVTLLSILFFKQKKYLFSALFAAAAQTIKSPGILLFAAYGLLFLYDLSQKRDIKKYFSYLLVPLTAFCIFYFYKLQTGDFLAYFHSGDNFHLDFLPYQVFISTRSWINSIWLEDVIYIYLIVGLSVLSLLKKYKWDIIALYPAVFFGVSLFVAHRDISRYLAPAYPFLFIAFKNKILSKNFKIIFLILLPAIFLYAINFIIGNAAPVADWTPYL